MIPDGWIQITLGEFISLQRGYDLTETERRPGSIPVVGSSGINGWHDVANVKGPGVTLGRSGASFGVAYYSEVDFWAHNTALFVTDFHGNHEKFIFYFLDYLNFASYNSGGAQPSLNRNFIYPIEIIIPPLAEQRQIAAILSTWDEAITLTEQLIEALQRRKQALMQLLLTGAVRFPEFDGEWEEVELGSYIDLFTGFAFSSEDFQDEAGIRLLRGINITAGETRWSGNLTKYWLDSEGLERYLLQENDIVIGMDGSLVGRNYAMLTSEDLPALLVQRVARLRAKLQMVQNYLYHNIASESFVQHVDSVKTVTAIPHISPKDIKEFRIGFPSEDEQSKIADALNISENEVRFLEKFREALEIQKRGLMQQLLTGAVRVQVEE